MRIDRLELYYVAVPLPAPLRIAAQPGRVQTHNELTFVRMTTDSGVVGESAGFTLGRFHAGLGDAFGKFILGRDPLDIEGFSDVLEAGAAFGVRLAWLEPALWDIAGKALGQPVNRLLGGGRKRIRAYCSTAELKDGEARADELERLREEGFTAVKLRFHNADWRKDLAVVEACRRRIGDSMDILIDANQGFHFALVPGTPPPWDVPTAVAAAQALEDFDVYWLEEPLDRDDYRGMRELRQKTRTRIAGGELAWRFRDYADLVAHRCLDVLQTDAMFFGGISTGKKVAAMAEANGLGFAPHTWNNGLNLIANLHVMASSKACRLCEFPYEPPGWTTEGREAILAETLEIDEDGCVPVPQRPGLGLVIDEEKLRRFGEKLYDETLG
ncbi:MAG: mandelate racemase/muconate lactonizing enzyme family protein [Acidobacteriota bacterium]|nr:mandelate racemase/muconate lactonizing enzyme family protein [Acidobacteriota bacterium]